MNVRTIGFALVFLSASCFAEADGSDYEKALVLFAEDKFAEAEITVKNSLQENPNYLYYLTNDKPLQILKPGNPYVSDFALQDTKLPAGHPEGIFDSMGNIYKGVARAIRLEPFAPEEFPSIEDGVRGMDFIEKTVESNSKGNVWVELNK